MKNEMKWRIVPQERIPQSKHKVSLEYEKIINEFKELGVRYATIEFDRSPASMVSGLKTAIKNLRIGGIRVVTRRGGAWLINENVGDK